MVDSLSGLTLTHYLEDDGETHVYAMSRSSDDRFHEYATQIETCLKQNGGIKVRRDNRRWLCKFKETDQALNAYSDIIKMCEGYGVTVDSVHYEGEKKKRFTPKAVHIETDPDRFKDESRPEPPPAISEHAILAVQESFNKVLKELQEAKKDLEAKTKAAGVSQSMYDHIGERLEGLIQFLEVHSSDTCNWRDEAEAFLEDDTGDSEETS